MKIKPETFKDNAIERQRLAERAKDYPAHTLYIIMAARHYNLQTMANINKWLDGISLNGGNNKGNDNLDKNNL